MPSEPIEQAIKGLLAEAAAATTKLDWATVASLADAALKLDPNNADALKFKALSQDSQYQADEITQPRNTTSVQDRTVVLCWVADCDLPEGHEQAHNNGDVATDARPEKPASNSTSYQQFRKDVNRKLQIFLLFVLAGVIAIFVCTVNMTS